MKDWGNVDAPVSHYNHAQLFSHVLEFMDLNEGPHWMQVGQFINNLPFITDKSKPQYNLL